MPQIKSREGIGNIVMYQLLHVYDLVDTYEKRNLAPLVCNI
jgi:hypothetical protein